MITDAYLWKIIGWNVSSKLEAEGAVSALLAAITQLPNEPVDLIHHSDRDIQYCCEKYVSKFNAFKIGINMTENGDPLENAIAERANGILKTDWLYRKQPDTKWQTASGLPAIIEAYNNKRPHLSLNMLTPEAIDCYKGEIPRRWKNY